MLRPPVFCHDLRSGFVLVMLVVLFSVVAPRAEAAVVVTSETQQLSGSEAGGDDSDDAPTVTFITAQGDAAADALAVTEESGSVLFTGPAVSVGKGCTAADGGGARCAAPGAPGDSAAGTSQAETTLRVDLGAGDDSLAVTALPGAPLPDNTLLFGGAGADAITGSPAPETIDGGAGRDQLNGGGGIDTYSAESLTGPVQVDLSAQTAMTPDGPDAIAGFENAVGGPAADTLTAAPAGSSLVGVEGADRLIGGDGPDSIVALQQNVALGDGLGDSLGADVVRGGGGRDVISAGSEDHVDAGPGNDHVSITPRDDGNFAPTTPLRCGAGRDTIDAHAAALLLPADCETFDGPSNASGGPNDGKLDVSFSRVSAQRLRFQPQTSCRSFRIRVRRNGRTTAVRHLRPRRSLTLTLRAGITSLDARGCGLGGDWLLQARLRA